MLIDLPIFLWSPIIAIVFVAITEGGNILDFWPGLVHKVSTHPKFTAIMYECPKCIAGQIALWWSLIVEPLYIFQNITLSIFIAVIWERINR